MKLTTATFAGCDSQGATTRPKAPLQSAEDILAGIGIRLERGSWSYDESTRLGPKGGFGEVFLGEGPQGRVAVKRLDLTAGAAAHREMTIGSKLAGRGLKNAVPVIDYGLDAESDRYFLVMPVCDESLQDTLARGGLTYADARPIILDILGGLIEADDLVHRDLKPGNVLLHKDKWCLADFGIAKFVEDSTSLQTLRGSLTPGYGAPEQWLGERPTHATDVYALGCLVYALLTGQPPFSGDADQIRDAHLHKSPGALTQAPSRIAALAASMLRKPAEGRPSLSRCKQVFDSTSSEQATSTPSGRLAKAASAVAQQVAAADAQKMALATRQRNHDALVVEAGRELAAIRSRLFAEIERSSEHVEMLSENLSLGQGILQFSASNSLPLKQPAQASPYGEKPVEVVCYATIGAKTSRPTAHGFPHVYQEMQRGPRITTYESYTYSASLIYSRPTPDQEYRWREVSFFSWSTGYDKDEPKALNPNDQTFETAFSRTVSGVGVAFGPEPIDAEDEQDFQNRWLGLFAKAATGELQRPSSMPISRNFFD